MGDAELCASMGDAGRKRVEQIFAWESVAAQTVKLYRGLLSEK